MRKKLAISVLAAVLSGGTLLAPAMAGSKNKSKSESEATNKSSNRNNNTSRSSSSSSATACVALCGGGDVASSILSDLLSGL